ncbi:hypothetical protein GCM10022243_60900 [Saccharothrix violaceirubra]|uniref:Uncharacterized protein n=1 Tax=Saccharothrix violaceirubra TaxID=413306 RepID=A0A7W7T8R7_9PSEU|nr:hypothetical protein [Saccharothrix violaceirubra]MBB4968067.1 hypothetical protein [Saccharothrix violaceirubra]
MTTAKYESTLDIGPTTYRLLATADPDVVVELTGVDRAGARVAEGVLRLPASGGGPVGKVLAQVLEALTRLGAPPTTRRPANANQPWTAERDEELRAAWLAADPGAAAGGLVREIAKRLERSASAIRARLAKVGCDPDVPGRVLSGQGAALLGVQGPDQGSAQGET